MIFDRRNSLNFSFCNAYNKIKISCRSGDLIFSEKCLSILRNELARSTILKIKINDYFARISSLSLKKLSFSLCTESVEETMFEKSVIKELVSSGFDPWQVENRVSARLWRVEKNMLSGG